MPWWSGKIKPASWDGWDRIWITNGGSNTVTRFPASDPGKAEQIKVGYGPRGVAVDSLGNAWVANTVR
jgi:DNA-binding beta-propeller fold protein YncE